MHDKSPVLPPLNHTLFQSSLVEIGLFDCPRDDPRFHDSGPINRYLVVFPRRAVRICHDGGQPLIASPRLITLYNHGQHYRRDRVSDYGDQSIWLRFRKQEIVEALHATGKAHGQLEREPLKWTHSPCSTDAFLLQRRLARHLMAGGQQDELEINEAAMRVLHSALRSPDRQGVNTRQVVACTPTRVRHQRLVRRCETVLADDFRKRWTLAALASELTTTPFHLCRVFARYTGKSIHQYVLQQRLRAALDCMIDRPQRRLTDIGLELGFATPSHFSQAFRQHFGISPREFRV